MPTVKERIAALQAPRRSVPLCMRADLVAEMQQAEWDLERLRREPGAASLAGPGTAQRAAAERIEALRQQMLDFTVDFTLKALSSKRFRALKLEYPPRSDNERDVQLGFDEQLFLVALVRACVVEPELDEEDWDRLLDEDAGLSEGQWSILANAAYAVNQIDIDIPFSPVASRLLATSEPT